MVEDIRGKQLVNFNFEQGLRNVKLDLLRWLFKDGELGKVYIKPKEELEPFKHEPNLLSKNI